MSPTFSVPSKQPGLPQYQHEEDEVVMEDEDVEADDEAN